MAADQVPYRPPHDPPNAEARTVSPAVPPELLRGVCTAYAELLSRQGTAASPFTRWTQATQRGHSFAWLGPGFTREPLLFTGQPFTVRAGTALFDALQAMRATVTLNPYERELVYGYPYLVGRRNGDALRGPVLVMPVRVEGEGGELMVVPDDEVVRFNSLPFRSEEDPAARDLAIRRVMDLTPAFPLTPAELTLFLEALTHTLEVDRREAKLDGTLAPAPAMPTRGQGLWLVDQAAVFIAPKTAYFLTSDLTKIAEGSERLAITCLGGLLSRAGAEPHVDITPEDLDRRRVYYPFPSNRAQRKVALLVEDPTTRLIRVEGPPGTGKSLTIANLACHLAATGKSVLITSQKDKALQVVDEKLRELNLPELPMTLLRHDRDSKRDLLDRLSRIKKERSRDEVEGEVGTIGQAFTQTGDAYRQEAAQYAVAIEWEERVEQVHRQVQASRGLGRLIRKAKFGFTRYRCGRMAPRTTDEVSTTATTHRESLKRIAFEALRLGRESAIATSTRQERQGLRELAQILQRNQSSAKNFSLFDRLKDDPQRAAMLLKLLPVWIMAPEDVARLFPCQPGLFHVVIVDEASQVDLPSITPVIFRGQKVAIFGDSKQMQPRRFAFMNQNVLTQAWQQAGMDRQDPERWLYPAENSLLALATSRAEEEALLDEHFRSLPPIIAFSNQEWYQGQLRIMTDETQKGFGGPEQPIIQLHHVPDGKISNGSQENEAEARALVDQLARMVTSEDYVDASIGVIALFEEQAALLQDLVAERIPVEEWEEHDVVVVTPDGFQGDERDVILYSLSWDNDVMPRQALSQRQRQHPHEQGMLNVAFTRARDEIHLFHSAPVETFTLADGRPGALTRWLQHCITVQSAGRARPGDSRLGRIDSEFEAEVAAALRGRGLRVLHQYPSCGFHIDLVCEHEDGTRIAVECDGERYHLDEHGQPKLEDLEREAILLRARWTVVRVPYRKWLNNPEGEVAKILGALEARRAAMAKEASEEEQPDASGFAPKPPRGSEAAKGTVHRVTPTQEAIVKVIREGLTEENALCYRVRDLIGARRLTTSLRQGILAEAQELNHRGLIVIEDREYFLSPESRSAGFQVAFGASRRPYRRRRYRRW